MKSRAGGSKVAGASSETGTETKLNAVIALLVALLGDDGRQELVKKRRANSEIVNYFLELGLTNKDLARIFNTTESSISELKTQSQRKSVKSRADSQQPESTGAI